MTDPFPEPAEGPPAETTPPSIAVNVHDVIDSAAEIAAEEEHPNITDANVEQAFEEVTK
jgi:hypothetical protein